MIQTFIVRCTSQNIRVRVTQLFIVYHQNICETIVQADMRKLFTEFQIDLRVIVSAHLFH